ncbi:glycosyltransferase family 2 protein [Olivibacter sp. LS-1]|uniref:glycosyltransferase family 2 protein n=2 Tax=unclassified Olivibacter TaxID=2632301 RepID=UPI0011EAE65D|nr:glycosyltransferase family 2 protein [Olivibacter sp. LS-1]QEL00359.1 glycosyltransferase family 2 protein [Olivibacter sp. LS-1]
MEIALVTVLYKSDAVLTGFFKTLSLQSFKQYHLYLIDNSPSATSDQLLQTLLAAYPVPAYTHIKNPANYGAAKGNNQGIELALQKHYSHILLLNNDIELVSPNLLQHLVQKARADQESIIIPKMLFYDSRKICMAGAHLNTATAVTVHIGAGEEDRGQYDQAHYVNYGPTTFMLLAREVLEKVGPMDERYFAYYEDTDLIFRATQLGYKIYYMPSLVILHKESSLTGGQRSPFFVYYINRNRIFFIRKHMEGLRKLKAIMKAGIDFLRLFKHYQNKQRKMLWKAIWDGFLLPLTEVKGQHFS